MKNWIRGREAEDSRDTTYKGWTVFASLISLLIKEKHKVGID